MSDFRNFTLKEISQNPNGVYDLADGLLPEMAEVTGYDGLGDKPTTAALQGFIRHIGPAKFLQSNTYVVRELLNDHTNPETIAADWADRSGSLLATHRSFSSNRNSQNTILKNVDMTAVFNTVVGRWQERRANKIVSLRDSNIKITHVVIFAGNRIMSEYEHPKVAEIAAKDNAWPTEARFAEKYIADDLLRSEAQIVTDVVSTDKDSGDEAFIEGLRLMAYILVKPVIAIGNAPSTVQVAGQFREAALRIDPQFDSEGSDLYMAGDDIEVARHHEGPESHQNPFTALGQIARNALVLHEQANHLRPPKS